jgi:hypothetical protein
MVRITLKDQEQIVSFLGDEDAARRLVAGCAAAPGKLGELLIATDLYQPGLAASVMADLMEFDKALQRQGPEFVHSAIALAQASGRPLEFAFQVIDDLTQRESLEPRGCEVISIDLSRRLIRITAGLDIALTGQVRVHDGEAPTKRTVTYLLPQGWAVEKLR